MKVSCADMVHLKRNIHVSNDLTVPCSTGKLFPLNNFYFTYLSRKNELMFVNAMKSVCVRQIIQK
jgi:hypothetical protein